MDIFCQVIDNFGDVGVVYRLANQLKKKYRIRIFIDSLKELAL
ncbi:MAG: elongation factor P maturation arginine rhamnosyltransferase EarP, partial [Fusobacteriaceae bacterium]